ncbi:MAG: O-antigen ligase [Xanthobacteraceae bacterium]
MAGGFRYWRYATAIHQPRLDVLDADLKSSAGRSLLVERLRWPVAIFAVVVQQGAFVSSPVLSRFLAAIGSPDPQANILNTLVVLLNILFVAPFCLLHYRKLARVLYSNKAAVALMALMFLSVIWSIHPDVTLRRDINYFSTVLTAFYLATQFDIDDIMRVLSFGISISIVFSFIFVAAFPIDAIHQPLQWRFTDIENIAGAWKGVFSHKNVLGHVMTVGVFTELYIVTGIKLRSFWKSLWHVLVLCGCVTLIIFARSGTALVLSSIYLLGAVLFVLWQRVRQYFGVFLAMAAVITSTFAIIFLSYPDMVLQILGSDPTLTGRTELWHIVLGMIWDRPLLGWGYSAMWLQDDDITIAISSAVGWAVPQAHNALLEVTLGLGVVGLAIVLAFVGVSVWRAIRCLIAGRTTIGMYSLVFFVGINISGITESTLAQNQNIEWVVFNILSICCGLELARRKFGEKLSYDAALDFAAMAPVLSRVGQ